MDAYDELDDAYDDSEDMELEDDEGDDSEWGRKKKSRPIPGSGGRQYAAGAKGVSSANISNGSGKTAQIKLREAAVTVPEFRKGMSEVQRDVQGSAKVIRELRDEVDRQKRVTKRIEKGAAWAGSAAMGVTFLEQVKDVLVDAITAHELTKASQQSKDATASGAETDSRGPQSPDSSRNGTTTTNGTTKSSTSELKQISDDLAAVTRQLKDLDNSRRELIKRQADVLNRSIKEHEERAAAEAEKAAAEHKRLTELAV